MSPQPHPLQCPCSITFAERNPLPSFISHADYAPNCSLPWPLRLIDQDHRDDVHQWSRRHCHPSVHSTEGCAWIGGRSPNQPTAGWGSSAAATLARAGAPPSNCAIGARVRALRKSVAQILIQIAISPGHDRRMMHVGGRRPIHFLFLYLRPSRWHIVVPSSSLELPAPFSWCTGSVGFPPDLLRSQPPLRQLRGRGFSLAITHLD